MMKNRATINRPVVSSRVFDSSSLGVLMTLFHRFAEAGDYDVKVRRADSAGKPAGEAIFRRFRVRTDAKGEDQVNVDLAAAPHIADSECACHDEASYHLRVDGVMGFYVSRGTGRFSVEVVHLGEKAKRTVLDSAKSVPAGDLLAVTLVRPGTYKATNLIATAKTRTSSTIAVGLPKPEYGVRHDTAKALVVTTKPSGVMGESRSALQSGQTLVFAPEADARFRVSLEKDESGEPDRKSGANPAERRRFRYQKPGLKESRKS